MKFSLITDITSYPHKQSITLDFQMIIDDWQWLYDPHIRECMIDQIEANKLGYVNDFEKEE